MLEKAERVTWTWVVNIVGALLAEGTTAVKESLAALQPSTMALDLAKDIARSDKLEKKIYRYTHERWRHLKDIIRAQPSKVSFFGRFCD
jgi:hypothetical protein